MLAGSFYYQLEEWWKTDGIKCDWLKCGKTTWKTRAWSRTTPVEVEISQSFPSPTKLAFETKAKPRFVAKPYERLLFSGIGIALGGVGGFLDIVGLDIVGISFADFFADDIVDGIMGSVVGPIDPQTIPIDSIINGSSSEEKLLSLMYDKSQTGFFSKSGSWGYIASQSTPKKDYCELQTVEIFCNHVRPELEERLKRLSR